MSLEVAEHIEPEYAEQYVINLCSFGDLILLTAAPPGQGGHGHVNCQPKRYWEKLFGWNGYLRVNYYEARLRAELHPWHKKKGIKAYYDNCMVFKKLKGNRI